MSKIKISVDGVLFDMPEVEKPTEWQACAKCHECFLNPLYCSDLCHRVYMEELKRKQKDDGSREDKA